MEKLFKNKTYIVTLLFSILIGFYISLGESLAFSVGYFDDYYKFFAIFSWIFGAFYSFVIALGFKNIANQNINKSILIRSLNYIFYSLPVIIITLIVKLYMVITNKLIVDYFIANIISDILIACFIIAKCIYLEKKYALTGYDKPANYFIIFEVAMNAAAAITLLSLFHVEKVSILLSPLFLLMALLIQVIVLIKRYKRFKDQKL